VAGVYEREWSAAALARALATNASGPLRLAATVLPVAADDDDAGKQPSLVSAKTSKQKYKVVPFDLRASKTKKPAGRVSRPSQAAALLSQSGEEFVVCSLRCKLFLWSLDGRRQVGSSLTCSLESHITCVATAGGDGAGASCHGQSAQIPQLAKLDCSYTRLLSCPEDHRMQKMIWHRDV
jgi:hypothetical protein